MPKSKLFTAIMVLFIINVVLLLGAIWFLWLNSTTYHKMHQQQTNTARYSETTIHTETNTIKLLEDKQNGKLYQYTIPNTER